MYYFMKRVSHVTRESMAVLLTSVFVNRFSFRCLVHHRVSLPCQLEEHPFRFIQEEGTQQASTPMLITQTLPMFLLMHHRLTRWQNSQRPLMRILSSMSFADHHQHQPNTLLPQQGQGVLIAQSQRTSVQSWWTKKLLSPPASLMLALIFDFQRAVPVNALTMLQLAFQAVPHPSHVSIGLTHRRTSNVLRHWRGCWSSVLGCYNNIGLTSLAYC